MLSRFFLAHILTRHHQEGKFTNGRIRITVTVGKGGMGGCWVTDRFRSVFSVKKQQLPFTPFHSQREKKQQKMKTEFSAWSSQDF